MRGPGDERRWELWAGKEARERVDPVAFVLFIYERALPREETRERAEVVRTREREARNTVRSMGGGGVMP